MAEELDEELYEELDLDEKRGTPCVSSIGSCCPPLELTGDWISEIIATFADILAC